MNIIKKSLMALAGGLLAVTMTPAVSNAATNYTIRQSDLRAPSDSAGDAGFQFLDSSLHIYTNNQTDYARLRWDVNTPLSEVHTVSFSYAGTTYGTNSKGETTGLPGVYYDVDADDDGTIDCELIGEYAYGGKDVWLNADAGDNTATSKSNQKPGFCAANGPVKDYGTGSGATEHGSLDDWAAAFDSKLPIGAGSFQPKSTVIYGGLLANGLVIDDVIFGVNFGSKSYSFTNKAASTGFAPTAVDTTAKRKTHVARHAVSFSFQANSLPAGSVQGKPLDIKVTVNGKTRHVASLTAGQKDYYRFVNKSSHNKTVRLYVGGRSVGKYLIHKR